MDIPDNLPPGVSPEQIEEMMANGGVPPGGFQSGGPGGGGEEAPGGTEAPTAPSANGGTSDISALGTMEPTWCALSPFYQNDFRYPGEAPNMMPNFIMMAVFLHGAMGALTGFAIRGLKKRNSQGNTVPLKLMFLGAAMSMLYQAVNVFYFMLAFLPCIYKAYVQLITFVVGYCAMVAHAQIRSRSIFEPRLRAHFLFYHLNWALLAAFAAMNIVYFALHVDSKRDRYGFCDFWPVALYWPIHTIQWVIHMITATLYMIPALKTRRRIRFKEKHDSYAIRSTSEYTVKDLVQEFVHALFFFVRRLPCARPFGKGPATITDERLASLAFRLWFPGIVSFPVTILGVAAHEDFPYGTIFVPIPELIMFSRLALRVERDLKRKRDLGSPNNTIDRYQDTKDMGTPRSPLPRRDSISELKSANLPGLGVGGSDIRLQNVTHAYYPEAQPHPSERRPHRRSNHMRPRVSISPNQTHAVLTDHPEHDRRRRGSTLVPEEQGNNVYQEYRQSQFFPSSRGDDRGHHQHPGYH